MTFADAFLMGGNGPERLVALFDVAGGDLARVDETKSSCGSPTGCSSSSIRIPDRTQRAEDETFNNVLDLVKAQAGPGQVSAAIMLNKADLVRFEEPVTRWLRSDSETLDPAEFLRKAAMSMPTCTKERTGDGAPIRECDKATLHVASPTGGAGIGEGGVYPRGVTPRRVLRPLVAMLAMTGVLTGPEAEKVGI